ncbi:MAG: hypothetical protein HQL19_06095 [Candidatus Omnitrophica bacterium]|nr:hypothetical protein [Candidatus Omnitrophota bacterium]
MKWHFGCMAMACTLSSFPAQADIFEYARPTDTELRGVMADDRAGFYEAGAGLQYAENEEKASDLKSFLTADTVRPSELYNTEASLRTFIADEAIGNKDTQEEAALSKSRLLLLAYSSPALADVMKHYRIFGLQRLQIESGRLSAIERASEGGTEHLQARSERECLKDYADRGLVEAMRLCMKSPQPFDRLHSIDRAYSLENGVKNIHVLEQALLRIQFMDSTKVSAILKISGEVVVRDRRLEEKFPETTFQARAAELRLKYTTKLNAVLEQFRASRHTTPAALEEVSLPGAPVTAPMLQDLLMLSAAERDVATGKMAGMYAFIQASREYRQAAAYLDLCLTDDALIPEFQSMIRRKKEFLAAAVTRAQADRESVTEYKNLLAGNKVVSDLARADMLANAQGDGVSAARDPWADMARTLMLSR